MSVFDELIRCRQWVEAALEYSGGTHSFEDIAAGVLSGRFQLWPAAKSVVVTEIVVYPKLKDLHIFLAGGDLEELKGMQPSVEAWGAQLGCSRVTLTGRKGWVRVFTENADYEPVWVRGIRSISNASSSTGS